MARSIVEIKQQMIVQKNAQASLSGLTSTSQTALWNLYIFLVAAAINIFEQILDLFKADIEAVATRSYPGSAAWIQDRVFKFQYDFSNPQYVQLNTTDFSVNYPVVNSALQIVTRCSVSTLITKTVLVKVAKNDPPEALDANEQTALLSYLYDIGFAGINYTVLSTDPDRMSVAGTIYYNGQFSSTIQASVIAALDNYLATLPFDGQVSVQGATDAIQAVTGVNDVALTEVGVRRESVAYASRTKIYDLSAGVNLRVYSTYAGYIIQEDDSGHTFTDTLTFQAQ